MNLSGREKIGFLLVLFLFLLPCLLPAQFNFITNNGEIKITGYTGTAKNVVIPDTINGLPVTGIGLVAFAGSTPITNIVIPGSVVNYDDHIFHSAANLVSVVISNGPTSLGNDMFYDCQNLVSVWIGDSVTNIGSETFYDCPALSDLKLPSSLKRLQAFTFLHCFSLTNLDIPTNVTTIDANAAQQSGFTRLTFPPNVQSIGESAFAYSSNLVKITFSGGPISLGDLAFNYCTNLADVTISANVTNLGQGVFASCSTLSSVSIDEGIKTLPSGLFYQCYSLTNIVIPGSVTNIEDMVFSGCSNLSGVFMKGNAPACTSFDTFFAATNAVVYYLAGSTGFSNTFNTQATALWNPTIVTNDGSFGVRNNLFGFSISGTTDIPILIEASTDLGAWIPRQSLRLTNGLVYFSDAQWTNFPASFYRIRSP
jgi:hypothetical protein